MLFLFINIFTVYLTSEMERPKRSKQAPKRFEEFVLDGRSVEENTDFGGNGRGRNGRGGKGRGRIAVRPTTLNTRTTGIRVHWY